MEKNMKKKKEKKKREPNQLLSRKPPELADLSRLAQAAGWGRPLHIGN